MATCCIISFLLLYFCVFRISVLASISSSCGQQKFSSNSGGNIQFKGNASSRKSCSYEINVQRGRRIVLTWKRFSVDGDMPKCWKSSVTVFIGCARRKVSTFCSRNALGLPHDVYSIDNCMKIVLYSTATTNEEFHATYNTFDDDEPVSHSSYCQSKSKLPSSSGVILSPKWPQMNSYRRGECEWEIRVPSSYVIQMNFMDIDLYKTSSFSCKSSLNRLRLKGEKSVLTSYEKKEYYCGSKHPFAKTTRYYQLELEYKTGYRSGRFRGFAVGYTAFKSEETVKAAKNQTKLAFIGLGIAIVVLVSCCIFFAWRRRRRSQQPDRAVYHSPPSQEPQAAIVTQTKAPDYGTGPPGGAPPPYSATMAQPPYQGYPTQTYPPTSYPSATPYPTNAPPYQTSSAPYPPTSTPASAEPYPGSMAYPGASAALPYQGDIPYQGTAPYPASQPPYPADASGQAPYPTK